MKRAILGMSLVCSTSAAMAIGPKWFLAGIGLASAVSAQCGKYCAYQPEFESFGDYLEDLTNCEKARLLPVMEERELFIRRANENFKKLNTEDIIDRKHASHKLRDVDSLYRHELKLLKAEMHKTQELLFDDCTSDESKEALAKHVSILADSIDAHAKYIEFFERLGD